MALRGRKVAESSLKLAESSFKQTAFDLER